MRRDTKEIKNIFLEIEYKGTNYYGWQIQNTHHQKVKTIQGVLEKALEKLFHKELRVIYSGRTDKGVHAYSQGINFKVATNIPLENIRIALNSFLPYDIFIKKIKLVSLSFHARFDVISKIYRYIILNKKSPSVFLEEYTWHISDKIDISLMRKAIPSIVGKRDFSVFARQPSRYKSCVREVKDITIRKRGSYIYIDIEADGFLRNMARNIVSFLVKIGQKKINLEDIEAIIKKRIPYTNYPAPSCGLYLYKVNYKNT